MSSIYDGFPSLPRIESIGDQVVHLTKDRDDWKRMAQTYLARVAELETALAAIAQEASIRLGSSNFRLGSSDSGGTGEGT